ncbi:hypothetical protein SAMN04489724_2734 [Algoriphagus locisalis]|uniref:YXWGXW repeat-containing protein n=1 Tax=Algoriphagus locisalis TaxID=305507 RepID=A0A1I7BUY2_9BACT|nr:DUF6600 domain-containing protein [Algoriphagus locisalis]SFT90921.1 hypothetical protein SAMN04489724_2734 [Algoriphagus locisalis]
MKTLQVPQWMRNLMMGFVALLWLSPSQASADEMNGVSFQVFYDELMPYGDWVKDARYGYVWLPAVHNEFHPYGTNGHWVMTNYGNTWVSDYDWGWAAFHYGRWYFDDNYQSWAWIPDYDWGPAWVDWRTGGGYYGWAPMGPGFTVSVRINMPSFYWVFVPQNRFVYHNVYSYCVPRARRVNIYNNTTIINNTIVYNNNRYYGGPARREIERVTKRSYPERRIENSRAPGRTVASRNAVSAYRPDLQTARGTTTAARPSRVLSSGQARTQPANVPSRGNSRTESVSGRSDNSGVRTVTPSSRGGEFKTEPYSGSQTRSTAPTRQSAGTLNNSRSSETRSTAPSSRQPQTRSTPARTQSSAPTQRSNESRTQPAPTQRSTQPRTQSAPAQRSTQPRTQSAPSRSKAPEVKSAPARSTQSRTQPSSSRSAPQVKSTPSRSSTPTKSSSRTSSSSSSRSSGNSRGNN